MKAIQVFRPYYRTEEITNLIKECCDIGWTGIGGKTLEFEENWKKYSGAKTCHMLNSATSGLHLALLQMKETYYWQDGDEILTTPLTFVSTNHAILYNNLKPVFVDIDDFGCMSYFDVEAKITPKTRAILFVGLGGNVGHLNKIIEIAKLNNLKIILDAAHMSGTKWSDTLKQIGCNDDVEVSIFSGQAVKNLPTADSGWICWNGENALDFDKKTRELSWLGINKDTYTRTTSEGSYKWYYDVPQLGYKFHSNSIMGCFGIVGLKYLEQDNAYRRYLADIYTHELEHIVEIVPHSYKCISSRHLFQILVNNRDEVMLALNQLGIYPGVHYRENTIYSMYNYASGTCPQAESFSKHTITLPLHMLVTPEDVQYICSSLKKIIQK